MNSIWESLSAAAQEPVFTGIVVAGLTGSLAVAMSTLLPYFTRIIREQFCTSLVIYNNEKFYEKFKVFLSKHKYAKTARTNSVAEWYSSHDEKWSWGLTPGEGWHFFWYKKKFYICHRFISATPVPNMSGWNGPIRDEKFMIYTIGRNQKALHDILEDVHEIMTEENSVPIHIWDSHNYELAQYKEKRSIDTIFIPDEQKNRIVKDISAFLSNRPVYKARGTPYRRGYLLSGPPGTGKSSLIMSLAGMFDKPVYIINPSTIHSDNILQKAFNGVEGNGILLIEDIDSINISKQRAKDADEESSGISLSGLLNAIDGIISRDGRILFITTNHPEKLDAALIRAGRIDIHERLDLMKIEDAIRMFECFYPDGDKETFKNYIEPLLPLSPADVQNRLLNYEI